MHNKLFDKGVNEIVLVFKWIITEQFRLCHTLIVIVELCLKDSSTVRWFRLHCYSKNVSCTNQDTVVLQLSANLYIKRKEKCFFQICRLYPGFLYECIRTKISDDYLKIIILWRCQKKYSWEAWRPYVVSMKMHSWPMWAVT